MFSDVIRCLSALLHLLLIIRVLCRKFVEGVIPGVFPPFV